MSDIYKKINELNSKYGSDFEEEIKKLDEEEIAKKK